MWDGRCWVPSQFGPHRNSLEDGSSPPLTLFGRELSLSLLAHAGSLVQLYTGTQWAFWKIMTRSRQLSSIEKISNLAYVRYMFPCKPSIEKTDALMTMFT